MWDIMEQNAYRLFLNKNMDLKLKVFEKQDCNEIYVNYKGHNVAFVMEIWGFGAECKEWNIKEKIEGDPVKDPKNIHFIIDSADASAFRDLIYFFLKENDADGMLRQEGQVDW